MEKCSDVNVNQKITYKRGTILSQFILLRFNFLINVSTRTEFIHKTALYHTRSSSIIMQVKLSIHFCNRSRSLPIRNAISTTF